MTHVLYLADDGRILSADIYFVEPPEGAVVVDEALIDGINAADRRVTDYRYKSGELIYDPLPVEEKKEKPSQMDIIEAQITYTAMMTGTLLEV